jgi:uncharacterized membrane protein YraQ (UPF0718 family)
MLAGPVINGIVIFSTWVAFAPHGIGPEVVGLRVGLAFLVAVGTALVVQVQYSRHGNALLNPISVPPPQAPVAGRPQPAAGGANGLVPESPAPERRSAWRRLSNISSTALHDFVDITVFLILGAVLAAIAKQQIGNDRIDELSQNSPLLAIPAMMFMAFVMCLCSEADAFVAASFKFTHISAKLAFLVYGPMLDIKLVLMYTRVFRPRLIVTIVTCVTIQVFVLCLVVHFAYQAMGWTGLPTR